MNTVIAGDYNGKGVMFTAGQALIAASMFKTVKLDKNNVESYELITDEHRKSAASGITRGIVGGAILGPVGLLAGLSAKNKGVYQVAIQFKDGCRSLLEVNDKVYKGLIKVLF